jgi:hypothetical protein
MKLIKTHALGNDFLLAAADQLLRRPNARPSPACVPAASRNRGDGPIFTR